jgi:hypothetical protein
MLYRVEHTIWDSGGKAVNKGGARLEKKEIVCHRYICTRDTFCNIYMFHSIAIKGVCLRPLACWGYGCEPHWGDFFILNVVCCALRGLSVGPIPRLEESNRVCVCVSLSVVRCNNNPLHLQWAGKKDQTRKHKYVYRLKYDIHWCLYSATLV